MTKIGVHRLEEHIDKIRDARTIAKSLSAETEPYSRYLGGLEMACELVTGNAYPQPEKDKPDGADAPDQA
jgi:hypothetical protein